MFNWCAWLNLTLCQLKTNHNSSNRNLESGFTNTMYSFYTQHNIYNVYLIHMICLLLQTLQTLCLFLTTCHEHTILHSKNKYINIKIENKKNDTVVSQFWSGCQISRNPCEVIGRHIRTFLSWKSVINTAMPLVPTSTNKDSELIINKNKQMWLINSPAALTVH